MAPLSAGNYYISPYPAHHFKHVLPVLAPTSFPTIVLWQGNILNCKGWCGNNGQNNRHPVFPYR